MNSCIQLVIVAYTSYMYYLYSRKILEEEFSTDEESDIIAYEESDIIATEELEGSAERYGNTFLLNWKQCALYPLLCSSGHSRCMTMYYVSSGVCVSGNASIPPRGA